MLDRSCLSCLKRLAAIKWSVPQRSSAFYSTEASVLLQDKCPLFRTLENNPLHHNENHIGKYYRISEELKNTLYSTGGIPKRLNTLMTTIGETCIMVRKPYLEIKNYLEEFDYSYPACRFVLYGKRGVGKTITLMHLVHFGFLSKYLLLHIPWVSNWTKTTKEVIPSDTRPGRADLPIESTIWLVHFKQQNLALLKELDLRTSQTYAWSQRESTEAGQPLLDVVEHGLSRGRHASDCIAVLLKEIKQQSSSGKFKTMVVIDGVNAFYAHVNTFRYMKPDKTLFKPMDVTIIRAFEKILKNDWNNAAIITTVDSMIISRDHKIEPPYTPRALLGKEGFEVLDPFIPVFVEKYTDKEIENNIDYLVDQLWLQHERAGTERGKAELKFLSNYNPYMLMRYCDPL